MSVRYSRPGELWHIDTTVIRLLDGTRAYLHVVIDNCSRRILAWRVADRSPAANSVAVLLATSGRRHRRRAHRMSWPTVASENVNTQVDALVQAGIVRRLLALTECTYSNSLIGRGGDPSSTSVLPAPAGQHPTVRRQVAFYVDEHNRVITHAAFCRMTPDDMFFGTAAGRVNGRAPTTPSAHSGLARLLSGAVDNPFLALIAARRLHVFHELT